MNDDILKDVRKYIPRLSKRTAIGICLACAAVSLVYRALTDDALPLETSKHPDTENDNHETASEVRRNRQDMNGRRNVLFDKILGQIQN